ALHKLMAAMRDVDAAQARQLASRVQLMDDEAPDVPASIETAILERRVVELEYEDRHGTVTNRLIEPAVFVGAGPLWYVSGWCRLRGGPRSFRIDRVRSARLTFELAPDRPDADLLEGIADLVRTPPLE
ncbi:MAG: helix-turn-helix transcriptional regulator, partial [Acidimicrobiales bacterium]